MNRASERRVVEHLDPEKVAYRNFRLNGFCRSRTSSFTQNGAAASARTPICWQFDFRFVPSACSMIRVTSWPTMCSSSR
jgi:hypothetical protein